MLVSLLLPKIDLEKEDKYGPRLTTSEARFFHIKGNTMTLKTDFETIRDNLIAELTAESANPRPDYSIDGRAVSWNDYRQSLLDQILELQKQINILAPYKISVRNES